MARKLVTKMRNHSIDILRLVCAFLVILLHVGTAYYSYTEPIARSAVPLFFMLSGYFYSGG
ncbi:MAG: acyltransferase family protein [Prevotella sp.]|nr:acyltransferase family protein [Prevotella sp.]